MPPLFFFDVYRFVIYLYGLPRNGIKKQRYLYNFLGFFL